MQGGATLRPRTPARGGSAPVVLVWTLLVLGTVLCLALAHRRRTAGAEVPALWIDPAAAKLEAAPEWTDPRWIERLERTLAACVPFPLEDEMALGVLRAELAHLSFVREVRRLDVDPLQGLSMELDLRRPVACIPSGDAFVLVDADGVLLDGSWPVPPRLGAAFLPVIGPMRERRDLFAAARAGDRLAEREHLDALDVAVSLSQHLSGEERAKLGRIVIDARGEGRAALDPGVRLELEDARVALFGRAPARDEPGELPAGEKWRSLARALALLDQDRPEHDWQLVDLRWDRPDLALREPIQLALASAPSGAPQRFGERRPPSSGLVDAERPRVR